ncbi:MAG: hypothetical protein J5699_01110 [Bacteroidales bacterium]|nr:hypothetical protein [Bacteroidales bacterium]
MFSITPQGLIQEIVCRILGPNVVYLNNAFEAFKNMPSLLRVINVIDGQGAERFITLDELHAAMNELLNVLDNNTDQNPNLNDSQKLVSKIANRTFTGMIYEIIVSHGFVSEPIISKNIGR